MYSSPYLFQVISNSLENSPNHHPAFTSTPNTLWSKITAAAPTPLVF
jgi:hypothetical protein